MTKQLREPTIQSIRISAAPPCGESACTHSRFGGTALLAQGSEWPRSPDGKPLHFLCQINLSEAATLPAAVDLPKTGWLAFFYDADEQPWGFDPKDAGKWLVAHVTDNPTPLTPPEALEQSYGPVLRHMQFADEQTISPDDQAEQDEEDEDPSGVTYHRLLGHPELLQNDWREECQLVSHKIYCGDAKAYSSPEALNLRAGAKDWILLFQLDSEDDGAMWGDCGRLYFCITKDALRNREFDKVWLILQCY